MILACRNRSKGEAARARILAAFSGAHVEVADLDLSSLASVHAASQHFLAGGRPLDLLINNAAVMALPQRRITPEGFELQLGTNHFGHFALTGLLLPALLAAPAARIVTVSSIAHRTATMDFADLNWERDYQAWPAYRRTKLANLLFAFELQRRLEQAQARAISIAVHPGVSNTNLFAAGPGQSANLFFKLIPLIIAITSQSSAQGALPTLYAATSPDARAGHFYGPDGWRQMRGFPVEVQAVSQAYDARLAARLWEVSEDCTDVRYDLPAARS